MSGNLREQNIQTKILKYLNECGYYTVKVVSATKAGVPDILTCVSGKFVAFEVKANATKKPTELQNYNLTAIKNSGGYAYVVYNLEQVKDIICLLQ